MATPPRLWTVAEYAAIGETEPGYTELVAGRLVISPSPSPSHQAVLGELAVQLKPQLPPGLELIPDIDVDLELAGSHEPGFSRRPDLVVVDSHAIKRVSAEGGLLKANDVVIVIEIVAPDSRRIDTVDKLGEYADAGIPWYWIVDITERTSLLVCQRLAQQQQASGTFSTKEPFPVTLDLDRLL